MSVPLLGFSASVASCWSLCVLPYYVFPVCFGAPNVFDSAHSFVLFPPFCMFTCFSLFGLTWIVCLSSFHCLQLFSLLIPCCVSPSMSGCFKLKPKYILPPITCLTALPEACLLPFWILSVVFWIISLPVLTGPLINLTPACLWTTILDCVQVCLPFCIFLRAEGPAWFLFCRQTVDAVAQICKKQLELHLFLVSNFSFKSDTLRNRHNEGRNDEGPGFQGPSTKKGETITVEGTEERQHKHCNNKTGNAKLISY